MKFLPDFLKVFLTKLAVRWLVKSFKDDPDFRHCYQANIAMPFIDEYQSHVRKTGKHYVSYPELHKISNDAANCFLDRLSR